MPAFEKWVRMRWCIAALVLLTGRVDAQEAVIDTSAVRLPKIPARQTWEQLVSLPGTLVYLPFHLLSNGVERLLALQEERRYIQRAYDLLTSDDELRGVRPAFESRSGVGVSFFDRQKAASCCQVLAAAMAGSRGRHGAVLDVQRPTAKGGVWRLHIDYRYMADEAFWGIGPGTPEAAKSVYDHFFVAPALSVDWPLATAWSLSGGIGTEFNALSEGRDKEHPTTASLFDEATLPGVTDEVLLASARLALTYDTRDRLGNPSRGWRGTWGANVQRQLDGDRFGFARMTLELVRYLPLFYDRVLVLRAGTDLVRPLGDRSIPFYRLSQIGDEATTIRGFDRGRFRGRQAVFGAVEYRYPVWRTLDALLFYNAGQVGRDVFDELDRDRAVSGYGVGLRAWSPTGRVTRLLLSRADDGTLLQFFLKTGF